jgi:hypothetical protein
VAGRPSHGYIALLDRVHCHLRPRTYVEIGVDRGRSLSLALPGTACVGIDPKPRVEFPLGRSTKLFRVTSDRFFETSDLAAELGDADVDLALIDGLHLFEFALRDFMRLEAHCHRSSVVLVHDCYPIDQRTSSRQRDGQRGTWSGDIWKLVLALREYRPDLAVHTVDVAPTGLGVVTGLDRTSTVLAEHYDEIVERYLDRPYSDVAADKAGLLNRVPDDWQAVRSLLPPRPPGRRRPAPLVVARAARWRPGRRSTVHRDLRQLLVLAHLDPIVGIGRRVQAKRARGGTGDAGPAAPL